MIRELRTLIAIAETGTFAAAGARLGLTQSAVSAQIQRLEGALGMPLFERTRRAASLNEAGQQALGVAHEIVALFDSLVSHGGAPTAAPLLRVGAIASAQPVLLTRALALLRERMPGARARVAPGVSLGLLGELSAGDLDLAVMIRPPFALPPELAWRPLLTEPFVLALPARSRHTDWREALRDEAFVRYDRASFGGRLVDQFLRRRRISVNESLELDEIDAIVGAVEAGIGVALVPLTHTHRRGRFDVRTLPLDAPGFAREIGVVSLREGERESPARVLADALEDVARTLG
ncbi:LysR family transcriptional regulator [Burkholderia sp. WAC0059]|uniref:LysR family transcriptional regulator n=1 Tax=Burkholderia sp. WAC0059 TaxID=2066022 RepID=UPI000C7E996D|nr:LysR family transcriptional regulator [Burkholderia sp. WAC0059]PLZ03891.1 LysR family transcriptional regulator [Burkholderia sp. WAC0059]